ncbi:MAG TPA: DEAD/DEAH box helicase [Spongiibacteraceae bacterium]|jgi:ATP-dependent RNA helicase RhlE|nr:DEAD/DEAH box helicase [Spongiibacteraceae bacterium]HUH38569.1 DEAD/DEAH box helicase [Spongiibacteraceae bacterium]
MTDFTSLGLSEALLRAVAEQGYDTPTPIQVKAIPAILAGRDVLAAAQTGTGKTAGFTLPLLHRLGDWASTGNPRALVLTPTRELAAQVGESVATYGKYLPLRSTVVFGGVKINPQITRLRQGVDVLVATPGRLLDLVGQGAVSLKAIEILVLDEADRMLDMGFIHDIKKVLRLVPAKRQNLLFSATFSSEIRELTKGLLNDPVSVEVAARNTTAERIEQQAFSVEKAAKPLVLAELIQRGGWEQVLVFTRTKHGANKLSQQLERQGINAAAIHGNKSQSARTKALAEFKAGKVRALVATDIAARGLDIDQLPHVVNFELPNVAEDYVHRIGRTGRAGASGNAVSLVDGEERKYLSAIERVLRQRLPLHPNPFPDLKPLAVVDAPDRPPRPANPRNSNRAGQGRPGNGGRSGSGNSGAGRNTGGGRSSSAQPRSNANANGNVNGNVNGNSASPAGETRREGPRRRRSPRKPAAAGQ